MICPTCGAAEVEIGGECPQCWEVAVAPEALDSLLSVEAEAVEGVLDDEPTTFTPLVVEPAVTVEGHAAPDASPTVAEVPGSPEPAREVVSFTIGIAEQAVLDAEPTGDTEPTDDTGSTVAGSAQELPKRRALADTRPQWGARDHPPAVMAPPPPAPLDAPAVTRTKAPSGTGLPASLRTGASATPSTPTAAPSPVAEPTPVEAEEPSHPRVRRWFGRGTAPQPAATDTDTAAAAAVAVAVAVPGPESAPGPSAFEGAPEGLLDGIEPEADLGDAVIDPGGVDEAASRLSAGARRSASAPLAVVAALLDDGERAEAVVQGEYQHRPGVAVLTDRRLIVANDRRWAPDVRTFECDERLVVHGWQDDRRATLVFVVEGVGVVLSAISDRPLARDLAGRVRSRITGELGDGASTVD